MKFFTFRPSTPSPEVSNILSLAFFGASPQFNIYSSAGVRNASDVRVMNPEMKGFIKELPTLPEEIQTGASEMVAVLQNKHMIRQIVLEDVMMELRGRCLEEAEMVQCIKWRASLPDNLTSTSNSGNNSYLLLCSAYQLKETRQSVSYPFRLFEPTSTRRTGSDQWAIPLSYSSLSRFQSSSAKTWDRAVRLVCPQHTGVGGLPYFAAAGRAPGS
jgi:hypothetical protein